MTKKELLEILLDVEWDDPDFHISTGDDDPFVLFIASDSCSDVPEGPYVKFDKDEGLYYIDLLGDLRK